MKKILFVLLLFSLLVSPFVVNGRELVNKKDTSSEENQIIEENQRIFLAGILDFFGIAWHTIKSLFVKKEEAPPPPKKEEIPGTGSTTLNTILSGTAWAIWIIGTAIAVIMFLYAAILFATAAGDPSQIAQAKKAVLWGVAGAAIIFLAYLMRWIIGEIIGL